MSETDIVCGACGTNLRPTSITAAGASYACSCGRTTMTRLNEGKLDLGLDDGPEHRGDDLCRIPWELATGSTIVSARAVLDECTELPDCPATLHLTSCARHR